MAFKIAPQCSDCGELRCARCRERDRLIDALITAYEALDNYSDVNDGDDGHPRPNRAMSALMEISPVLTAVTGGDW